MNTIKKIRDHLACCYLPGGTLSWCPRSRCPSRGPGSIPVSRSKYFAENGTKNRFDQKIGEKEHKFFLKANHDSWLIIFKFFFKIFNPAPPPPTPLRSPHSPRTHWGHSRCRSPPRCPRRQKSSWGQNWIFSDWWSPKLGSLKWPKFEFFVFGIHKSWKALF